MTWRDFVVALTSCIAQKRGNQFFISDRAVLETSWVNEFMVMFPRSFERDDFAQGWILRDFGR